MCVRVLLVAVAVQVAGCAAQAHGAMLLAEEGEVGEADGTHGIDTLASVACRPALRDAMSQGARRIRFIWGSKPQWPRCEGSHTCSAAPSSWQLPSPRVGQSI